MHPARTPKLHPSLTRRIDAAAEVWRGLYGDANGNGTCAPTDAEVEAAEAALGVSLPPSFVYFCSRAAVSLRAGSPLKLVSGSVPPIVLHNRALRAGEQSADLVSFWEGDDGDFCIDVKRGAASREHPVVYVDHWSGGTVAGAGRHFFEWLTGMLKREIDARRAQLGQWEGWLAGG